MRAKNVRRSPATPPPQSGGGMARNVLIAIGLLVLGASFAIVVDRLTTSGAAASPSPSPSNALVSPSAAASPTAPASASPSPSPSPSPASAVLEALMPKSVNGTTLTVVSAKDVATLGNDSPTTRAMAASIKALGQKPTDLELAEAYDPSSSLKLSIIAFRLPGLDVAKLRPVVLDGWLSAGMPGVKTTQTTLARMPVTKVSYGDTGPDQYLIVKDDAIIVIQATDVTTAAAAAELIGSGASGSPSPSGSVAPSATPAASPSASPSPS